MLLGYAQKKRFAPRIVESWKQNTSYHSADMLRHSVDIGYGNKIKHREIKTVKERMGCWRQMELGRDSEERVFHKCFSRVSPLLFVSEVIFLTHFTKLIKIGRKRLQSFGRYDVIHLKKLKKTTNKFSYITWPRNSTTCLS